ncbi:unnamed protein product [Peronospora farinosa]|uniref:RxLR effector PexRD54 WY domain-containing protein n=1 Tax=Peronospora farinosa TaxID=134698 RepID=A0AAV0UAK5_9STRA|nr:unnamed protein product [Peronospora farinosa]
MSSAARISCALVVVALVFCSAQTVATPKSNPGGVASTTLHSSHAPAAINRRLKRTTAMETSESSEERALNFHFSELAPSFSSLKSIPAAIYQKMQIWVWRLMRKSSDDVFKLLKLEELVKLDTEGTKLFRDLRFMKWVLFVEARYSKDRKAGIDVILSTLKAHYREDAALADVLVAGLRNPNTYILADVLLTVQLQKWCDTGKSVESVFTLLKLHDNGEGLFESPQLVHWLEFVGSYYRVMDNEAYNEAYKSAMEVAKILSDAAAKKLDDAAAIKLTDKEAIKTKKAFESAANNAIKIKEKFELAAKEAEKAFKSADRVPAKAALSILRYHYNDETLTIILDKGSKVKDDRVKNIAVRLAKRLKKELTHEKS